MRELLKSKHLLIVVVGLSITLGFYLVQRKNSDVSQKNDQKQEQKNEEYPSKKDLKEREQSKKDWEEKKSKAREELEKELDNVMVIVENKNYKNPCKVALWGSNQEIQFCFIAQRKYLENELEKIQQQLDEIAAKPNNEIFNGRTNETYLDHAKKNANNFRSANNSLQEYIKSYCSIISDSFGSGSMVPTAYGSCMVNILEDRLLDYRLESRLY